MYLLLFIEVVEVEKLLVFNDNFGLRGTVLLVALHDLQIGTQSLVSNTRSDIRVCITIWHFEHVIFLTYFIKFL